ncbi:hypothetical protein V8C34DRAFT_90434 [Trichoderma compactum]
MIRLLQMLQLRLGLRHERHLFFSLLFLLLVTFFYTFSSPLQNRLANDKTLPDAYTRRWRECVLRACVCVCTKQRKPCYVPVLPAAPPFATTHNRSRPSFEVACCKEHAETSGLVACQEIRGLSRNGGAAMVGVLGFSWASPCEAIVVLCLPEYVLHTDEKNSAVALSGFGFLAFGIGFCLAGCVSLYGAPRLPHVSHKMNQPGTSCMAHVLNACYGVLLQETWA